MGSPRERTFRKVEQGGSAGGFETRLLSGLHSLLSPCHLLVLSENPPFYLAALPTPHPTLTLGRGLGGHISHPLPVQGAFHPSPSPDGIPLPLFLGPASEAGD